MDKIDFNKLSSYQLDVLKEVGNIGAGNAATALSKLLKKKITMCVPNVRIMEFKEVSYMLENAEKPVIGVLIQIVGDFSGYILIILEYETVGLFLNNLAESTSIRFDSPGEEFEFSEMELSALKEVGNILAASYLSALSDLTGLRACTTVPSIAIDMAGSILSFPAIEMGKFCSNVMYIEAGFYEGTNRIKGDFILIPALEAFEVLLKVLGASES
ncbi:MAG TPA: chemotaxis protein CheC [Clostridiaceae bacterium]|nr:chemotaxis protein CheC [Clostridiaceae bacterium]